jgi:hypothetical protein
LLSCAERLNQSQIGVFDEVLVRLLDCVGARALAELSVALANFASSPERTMRPSCTTGCSLFVYRPSREKRVWVGSFSKSVISMGRPGSMPAVSSRSLVKDSTPGVVTMSSSTRAALIVGLITSWPACDRCRYDG